MATHDVPGANPKNADVLAMGCWAEHEDGSLILVKSTEGGRVVYEIYDMAQTPPVYYQDAMPELAFKKAFSYDPKQPAKDRWTWHDKTQFPWDRVMKDFSRPRPHYASAEDLQSAAQRVAESLNLRGRQVAEGDVRDRTERSANRGRAIVDIIAGALRDVSDVISPRS